jgi:hypothetical protein
MIAQQDQAARRVACKGLNRHFGRMIGCSGEGLVRE